MRVAIVTQPLMANYGGILQNYALQQVLKELGHEPVTIDYFPPIPARRYIRSVARWILKGAPYKPLFPKRPALFDSFVRDHIKTLPAGHRYSKALLKGMDAIIVGSDQVWRPIYNVHSLSDMFLSFAGDFKGPRIAYSASFGIDSWDVDKETAARCANLARKFKAISVREPSGVGLCQDYLGVEASVMPDPVRLLEAADYLSLCKDVPVKKERYIAAYILDLNEETENRLDSVQNRTGLPVWRFTADKEALLSVPEWLAAMRDAQIIVTDSYHGAVLGQLFEKPCEIIENSIRGRERFSTLKQALSSEEVRNQGVSFLEEALK